MGTKNAVFLNFLAGLWTKGSIALYRVIQVPLFLYFYDTAEYGRWIVLSSLPVWLSLSGIGFGSVASNELSIAAGNKDWKKASQIYTTSLVLIGIISLLGSFLVTVCILSLPIDSFVMESASRETEISWAMFWLSTCVFFSFFIGIFSARYRAAGKAHRALLIGSFRPWLEVLFLVFALGYCPRFDCLAFAGFGAMLCFLIFFAWRSSKELCEVQFQRHLFSWSDFRYLLKKGLAFQAFPVGNAVLFQGSVLVVHSTLGPVAVALFSTARTLVRAVNQMMEAVNQSTWPELSLLFGRQDFVRIARLHRLSVLGSVSFATIGVILLTLLGQPIYNLWTQKALSLDQQMFFIFLLAIPFNALWFTSSVVHAASNKHEGLAIRYLLACFLSIGLCWVLCKEMGLIGAAFSSLVVDLILIPYVFRKSLMLSRDHMGTLVKNLKRDVVEEAILIRGQIKKGTLFRNP